MARRLAGYHCEASLSPVGMAARTEPVARHAQRRLNSIACSTVGRKLAARNAAAVPATPTAPAFTIDGFTDVSFAARGWALRASAKYQIRHSRRAMLSLEHQRLAGDDQTVTFTVISPPGANRPADR
jgi:hypothetical protein